ncbi:MAG: hypothetical protein HYT20_02115, partial [Candidatus Nealsonbacteria bacterium]|nr:hypothetical protein [Candidatus Nealsonbacteria bacterium]
MIKKIAILFLMSAAAGIVHAQEATETAVAPEQAITISDLGVSDPKVLPTSPFYFFKEMGRGVQGFFTFNPVAKAELELKITNEKAAEVKKITETQPEKTAAIQKALENYQKSQERLRAKLENLKETSQNPKVDTLLSNLTDRVVKHEKLFDEISLKFKDKENVSKAVSGAMAGSENVIGEASKKDDPAKFSSRVEKALLEAKDGDLKNVRSVEIIDRLSGKTTATTKESLGRLREDFSKKSEQDIQDLLDKKGEKAFKDAITSAPGDVSAKSIIIEEIQKRSAKNLSQSIGRTIDELRPSIDKEKNINEKTREQIGHAEEKIQELEKKISESTTANVSTSVSVLLNEAKDHLAKAKTAFNEEKYGEAFGQARSAEVSARNALRSLEEEKPETEDFSQHLKELEEKIRTYEKLLNERNFTRELNKEAFGLLDNAVLHLGYAKEAFANGNTVNTKLHIGHVKEFLSKLSRFIEIRQIRSEEKPSILPTAAPQPTTAKPVEPTNLIRTVKPIESAIFVAKREFKIEADDLGFYPESTIKAPKGSRVEITFLVRTDNVY